MDRFTIRAIVCILWIVATLFELVGVPVLLGIGLGVDGMPAGARHFANANLDLWWTAVVGGAPYWFCFTCVLALIVYRDAKR